MKQRRRRRWVARLGSTSHSSPNTLHGAGVVPSPKKLHLGYVFLLGYSEFGFA